MLTFNALLQAERISPSEVKLVRHQVAPPVGCPTPFQLWKDDIKAFELYQRIQRRDGLFSNARYLASFVGTPLDETVFVALYEILDVKRAPRGMLDPISRKDIGGHNLYDLARIKSLETYQGKLIIEWGPGYRAWVQRASAKDKAIIEMRRTVIDPPFPGFLEFRKRLSELIHVPMAWRQALSSVSGIYLLTCPVSKKHYVGSANGTTGFWGRWENYVANGHGGNRRMLGLTAADYQVCILEVAASSTRTDDLLKMESLWKQKLMSRQWGLNGN